MEGCVDINSPVFKQFCKDYEVSEGQMEIWIKSWWKTHDDGSFPDEDFINKKKYGESIEMSDEGIAAYSSEFVESGSPFYEIEDRNMAKSYYEYLKKRFDQRAIGAYTRADGKIVISVAKPKVSPDSKLKDLKIPTIGSKIVFPDGDIRTVTGVTVEQRLGRIHVRFGNNETIGTTLFMDKDNPNRFYYMKGKPNAYDKPDPTRYYIKIEGPTSLYYEGRYEVASNNVNPNTTSKESTEHVLSTINIYAGTGENAHLSNFANRPFTVDSSMTIKVDGTIFNLFSKDTEFNSVEQAFQAAKIAFAYDGTEDSIDDRTADSFEKRIQQATPAQARSLGRQIPMSKKALDDWNKYKEEVMKMLIKASFEQNPDVLKQLIATGDATLTHTQDRGEWRTLFPKVLMEVREELRGQEDYLSIVTPIRNNLKKVDGLLETLPRLNTRYFKTQDEMIEFLGTLSGYNPRLKQLSEFLKRTKQDGKSLSKVEYNAMVSLLRDVASSLQEHLDNLERANSGEVTITRDYMSEPIKVGMPDIYFNEDKSTPDNVVPLLVKNIKDGKVTYIDTTENKEYTVTEQEFRKITGLQGSDFRYSNIYGFADVYVTAMTTEDGHPIYSLEIAIPYEEYRGRGHGLEIYESVIEELASRGAYLTPGNVVSSNHVWEALERRGRVKEVTLTNGKTIVVALPKTPINNKLKKEENGQRRIYTESLSDSLRKGWKGIGRRTEETFRIRSQEQNDNKQESPRGSRLLDDVVSEASSSLDKELETRGIKATKQPIRVASPREFHKAISEAKAQNPNGFMVDVHDEADYENDLLLITEDGKSGIAITPEGDIISVFSAISGDHRLDKLMFMAIAAGGYKLDCFYLEDINNLVNLYSKFGFKVGATTPFNAEQYKPEGYDEWKSRNQDTEVLGVAAMYLDEPTPLDTYSFDRNPGIESATVFDGENGYNNALQERDKILENVNKARQQASQAQAQQSQTTINNTTTGDKSEVDEDQKFIDESVALRNSLTALQTSKVMTASEAKDVADQMVNFISDMITDILENKNNARENWSNELKDIDFSTASRIDIARAIGPKNLIDACKNNFLKSQSDARVGRKTAAKVRLILNNWNALMQLASNTFIANEKFTIDINDNSDNSVRIVEDKYIDADNLNDPNDTDDVNEVEGSAQEHWQIETRTMDVLENATALVRHALRSCFILDSNGNPELTEFGIKKRVKIQTAVSSILRWTQGAQTLSDMIDMLKNKADSNPWINQIIERLEKEKGDDVYFQSQFFNVFCKRWQGYSVVKAFRYSDGKITFKSIPVNTMPALKEAANSVVNQYKIGQHPLFTSQGVNTSALAELDKANTELQELRSEEVNDENLEAISKNIGFALHTLGYYASLDDIIEAVKDVNSRKKMIDALNYMVSSLSAHKNDSNYQPFGYKTDGSILGNLRELLAPITDRLEDTAISSFYEDGKMYQSYTVPSYLTNLLSKFHTSSEENFINFISKQYGVSEWFKRPGGDVDSGWRNPWLSTMMKNPKARQVFDHKVQLSFNRQAYMTEMDDLQYTLSIMAEFFSTEVGEGESEVPAWFRVPMLSNKTSSEYIKFYRKVGDRYRESIVNGMSQIMLQEISRIRTVKIRNLDESSPEYIKNWDGERGKSFTFITFLNDYLEGGSKANSELGELLAAATSKEGISDAKQETLIKKAKEVIMEGMQERVTSILEEYKREGIVESAKKLEHIGTTDEEVLANLENFVWNDTFAAMNILQLTIGDTAFYSDTVDLQKRFAQIHAPGIRPNKEAKDQYGNRVADDYSRTMVLNDFEDVRSNVIENVEVVFGRKIENATTPAERAFYENLKNEIIDGFSKINVTDAQAYNCPTSYRKKAIMFGKWDKRAEELFKKVQEGNYTYQELSEAFQILKPFAYTQTAESVGKEGSPISTMPIPFQNKNSEYLLIMADAILKGEDTGKPNLLRAIFEVMEESAKEDPTKGIDTVQFKSAVKSGSHGVIDIHQFLNKSNGERMAKEHLLNAIYKLENIEVTDKQTGEKYTTVRRSAKYNRNHVRFIDWMDYGLQQEVPSHFNQHYQAHGSQIRAITISDLSLDATFMGMPTKEFAKEYEKTIAENIQESIKEIEESFRLSGTRKERNIALSKILRREVASSSRYGIDLMQAVLLDENGEFNMPLGDPIQARRIEQLLNSIIKNTVNKQTIAGGPVVQVSCFGTSKDLNIRFKDKSDPSGKTLLMTKKEWEESKDKKHNSYKEYIKENQGGIAYFEVYAPIYANELLTKFISPDGTIDVEAIEAVDPELLKMIGYRIPTEDKYSCAPLKIVGFLPREAGDGIMLPADITLLSGSDFDVDKMYLMRKEILIAERYEDKIPITDETSPEVKDYLEHNRTSAAAHLKKVLADTINLDEYFNNVAESISKKYVVDRKLIAKHRKEELEEAERRSALFEESNAKKLSEELAEAEKKNSLIEATNEEEEKEKQEKLEKAKEKIEARYKVTQDKEKKRLERVKKNIENKYREQINDSYGREHKETEKAQLRALNVTVDKFISTKTYNVPLNKLSGLDRLLKTEYLKYVYKTIYPVKGRAARNNKIIDMTYEVLTHEDSADKILNPGGFEPEKRMGYMIQAYRTGRYKWEDLKNKSVKELKKLVMSDDNLAFIDTHVQFYKQNSAAAALIGVCAVHKVSHAFIERDPIYLDFSEATKYKVPFKLGNTILKGKVKIDPTRDSSGNYVGRTLGSLVASSADAAKDPVLNLMNINKSTINILTTAVRLGIPFEDAALLLSQESFRRIVTEQNRKRLKGEPSSLQSLVSERINTISKEAGFKTDEDKAKILEEGLTEGELVSGLVLTSKNTEFKALSMIQALLEAGKSLKGITTATKQNSISNSVGPLIIDNHMLEYKMQDFSEFIYIRNEITGIDSRVENINGIFELHPMLGSFKEGIRLAREIFSEMPIARFDFTKLINSFELLGTTDIMSDRRLLGKLADFYTSYLLVNSGVINPEECRYYIEDFPKELFGKENNIKDKYRGNPLIDALKLNVDNNTGFVSIKVDTTGLDTEQKDILISGYIDLLSKDKELAIKLFKYNFFRGGIGFNPKTFMNLTPIFLKEAIEGYKETFSKSVETNAEDVMDLFIRNTWEDNSAVKFLDYKSKDYDGKDITNYHINDDGSITILEESVYNRYKNYGYIKIKVGKEYKLYKRLEDNSDSKILFYRELTPLGNHNAYLEFTDEPIKLSDNITPEDDNGGGLRNLKRDNLEGTQDNDSGTPEVSLDLVKRAFIGGAGLSADKTELKLAEFKAKSKEEKSNLERSTKDFLAKQFSKLNIRFNEDSLDKIFKLMC